MNVERLRELQDNLCNLPSDFNWDMNLGEHCAMGLMYRMNWVSAPDFDEVSEYLEIEIEDTYALFSPHFSDTITYYGEDQLRDWNRILPEDVAQAIERLIDELMETENGF